MTQRHKENYPIEINTQVTEMVEIADKGFKTEIITIFKILKKKHEHNENRNENIEKKNQIGL